MNRICSLETEQFQVAITCNKAINSRREAIKSSEKWNKPRDKAMYEDGR